MNMVRAAEGAGVGGRGGGPEELFRGEERPCPDLSWSEGSSMMNTEFNK